MTEHCLSMNGCKCQMQGDLATVGLYDDERVSPLHGLIVPDVITHKLDTSTLLWIAGIVGGAILLWRSK